MYRHVRLPSVFRDRQSATNARPMSTMPAASARNPVKSSPVGPPLRRVIARLDAGHDAEDPEEEREDGAEPGAESRIPPRRQCEDPKWHEPADEVVRRRGSRLRLEEVVVDDVERDEPERHASHARLGQDLRARYRELARGRGSRRRRVLGRGRHVFPRSAWSRNAITRRSYSSGSVVIPATCWPFGTSQICFGSRAAS